MVKQRSRQPDTLEPEVRLLPGACLRLVASAPPESSLFGRLVQQSRRRAHIAEAGVRLPHRPVRPRPRSSGAERLPGMEETRVRVPAWAKLGVAQRGPSLIRTRKRVQPPPPRSGLHIWIVNRPRRRRRLESGRAPSGLGCESSAIRLVLPPLPGCSSAQESAAFGTQRSRVQSSPPRSDLR